VKPYYEHAGITIYHGDCREILPQLPKVDGVLTDPPYGHGWAGIASSAPGCRGWTNRRAEKIVGADIPFDPQFLIKLDVPCILWGANHYADKLPPSAGWLVWDKREGTATNNLSDCEMAWRNVGGSARLFRHMWNGLCRASEVGDHLHPTQKPIELMQWCLGFLPNSRLILDPFAGSGTTLIAAKNLNRRAIGIEIEEKYCEIAAKRLSQEVFAFPEFAMSKQDGGPGPGSS